VIDIGVMQGRMLLPFEGRFQAFPAKEWQEEFALAAKAGIACIEWIFEEAHADENPLRDGPGIARIKALCESSGVGVRSICADWFMTSPLLRRPESIERLEWLIDRGSELGVRYILLPFVDASSLTEQERVLLPNALARPLALAEAKGLELHLETDLDPDSLAALLERIVNPNLRVTYDIGNSAAFGYDPVQEFAVIGNRLGSVHVKDRKRGGGSVPLGEGDADLPLCFRLIRRAGAPEFLILQAARGQEGDEAAWIGSLRSRVETLYAEAAGTQ